MKAYSQLERIFEKITTINNISNILNWDSSVIMPNGGHESRTSQQSYLTAAAHELINSQEIEDLLNQSKED